MKKISEDIAKGKKRKEMNGQHAAYRTDSRS